MSTPWQLALGINVPTTVSAGSGRIDMSDPQYLDIHGGQPGYVLVTDGAAHLAWEPQTGGGLTLADTETRYANVDGDSFTGPVFLAEDPTAPLGAATKSYVDGRVSIGVAFYLPLTGGTLTGPLLLSGPPTTGLHPATKAYVDSLVIDAGTY